MTRIFVYNVPTTGHVNPTLPLVAELVRRGVTVTYTLTEGYRAKIEAAGAVFRQYQRIDDDYFVGLDGSNPLNTAARLAQTTFQMLPQLITGLQQAQPDAVLFDSMCPWGKLAADAVGIPTISSMSLLIMRPRMLLSSGVLWKLAGLTLRNRPYLQRFWQKRRLITSAFGLAVPGFPDFLNLMGDLTINYTSALVQPEADKLNDTIKFVGPAVQPRPHDPHFPFDQLDERPLIYISLGTVINRNPDFYRRCIRALGGMDVQVVMSTGRAVSQDDLGDIPANFIVRSYVPQLEILQRAAVFITHAGMNSVHEGLYHAVPLILAPQQTEQRLVANRVVELGAGLLLSSRAPSPSAIQQAVRRVLHEPQFCQRAAIIGESLRSAGGEVRAADEILALVNRV